MNELELAQDFAELVSLTSAAEQLASTRPWPKGYASKVLVKTSDLRLVLLLMQAGSRIPEHHSEGRSVVHCLKGALRLQTPDEARDLREDDVLALDRRVTHDVQALEDSAFLLTMCLPSK
jgi:quercetin dioxygenase-like cupin family protein